MKTLSLSLLSLALAGCAAVGPDFRAPAIEAPASHGEWHGGAPALRDTGLAAGTAHSFARFDDAVLRALQQQALAANFDLRTAALRFAESRAQRNFAASGMGPQVSAHVGAGRQRQSESGAGTRMVDAIAPANREALIDKLSDPFKLFQAGFDAAWELDLWGRVRRAVQAADAGMAQASSLLRQAQLSVQVEVARNYYELRLAQRQQGLLQAEETSAREAAALLQARRRGGLASDFEVERAQAALAELQGRQPALLEAEAQAINRLTLLTAQAPGALQALLATPGGAATRAGAAHGPARDAAADAVLALEAPFGAAPDLALGVPGEVMRHRPDIQAAEARLQGATARVGVAVADLYPRVTLGLALGLEALAAGNFGDWGSRQWSLGPSLSLPLFDNGRRRASVELRELEQQEAAIAFQQTVLKAWHEMDDALSAYAAERQRRQAIGAREASARSTLQLAQARARRGLGDHLPVLEAQRALLAVQRERLHSEAALTLKLLAVCKASGLAPQA